MIVNNDAYLEGRSSSIQAGVAACPEAEGILITGCDQPLDRAVIDKLLAGYASEHWDMAFPSVDGRRGHPPLFSGRLREELLAIDEATEGLRAVSRRHRDRSLAVEVADPRILLNLNTPEDYALAQCGLSGPSAGL